MRKTLKQVPLPVISFQSFAGNILICKILHINPGLITVFSLLDFVLGLRALALTASPPHLRLPYGVLFTRLPAASLQLLLVFR